MSASRQAEEVHEFSYLFSHQRIDEAMSLFSASTNKAALACADLRLSTPLEIACMHERLDVVNALLAASSDANALVFKTNGNGLTALFEASVRGRVDVVHALLNAAKDKSAFVSVKCKGGYTAFHQACILGRRSVVEAFLALDDECALVSIKDAKGRTPLDCAVEFGQYDVANVLLPYLRREQGRTKWAYVCESLPDDLQRAVAKFF